MHAFCVGILIPILAGALLACPWFNERMYAASWLGLLALFVSTWEMPAYISFRRWLLAGFVYVGLPLYWFPAMAADTLNVSRFTGFMAVAMLIVWDAFRFGVFGYLMRAMGQRERWFCLTIPFIWTALEFVWPHIFPWRLGHSQIGWLPMMQLGEISGVYGVSFVMILVAASAANGMTCRFATRHPGSAPDPPRVPVIPIVASLLILATVLFWGRARLRAVAQLSASGRPLRVAAVQPGERGPEMLQILRRRTGELPEGVDLVIWPETSVGNFSIELASFSSQEEAQEHSRSVSDDPRPMPGLGKPLLCVGGSYNDKGIRHGTAFLVGTDEQIIGRYHKRFLVPWGEYVVGQQWIPGLESLLGGTGDYQPGTSAEPLTLPETAQLGILICYEDLISEAARETVNLGSQLLINVNNLSAFGESPALMQHQQIARSRAIETRRWLVRCGMTGSTAVISPSGRVELQALPHRPATLVADINLLGVQTFYVRWGDVLGWTALIVSGLLVLKHLIGLVPTTSRTAEKHPEPGHERQASG